MGSSTAKDSTSVCSCEASLRPGVKGTVTLWPAFFAACSTPAQPPRTIRSASETFLPPLAASLNALWMPSSVFEHLRQLGGLVDFPILLRREADARAVGAAALVAAAEARRGGPCGRDKLADRQPRSEDFSLQRFDVLLAHGLVIDGGNRVLPDQLFFRHQRAQIARPRTHVAMRQLEPGARKGLGQLLRVLQEAPRYLFVDGVEAQREVGGQHRWRVALFGVVRVRNQSRAGIALGLPLVAPAGLLVSSHS